MESDADGWRLETAHSGADSTTYSSEGSLDTKTNVLLAVECITAPALKKYLVCHFFLRSISIATFIVFTNREFTRGFTTNHAQLTSRLSTAVGGVCLIVACGALLHFVYRVWKVSAGQQQWSQQRQRLAALTLIQLTMLTVAVIFFVASNAVASTATVCSKVRNFCKWSEFVQWTSWNVVIITQLTVTHCACVWTDAEAKPRRPLVMNSAPWMKDRAKNALILDAPWSIHLPKVAVWTVIQATIFAQLVEALQGKPYVTEAVCFKTRFVCRVTTSYTVLEIARCVMLATCMAWHLVLIFHGLRDAARMPYQVARMGRLLIRMACSSDLGLGSNLVATVTLIMATTTRRCSSCTPNYLMLSLVLETTTLLTMASRLIQPKSCSTDESVFLQAWLQKFAWTDSSLKTKISKRNALPQDEALLEKEPMFCFETAVKLLYWSAFVYEHGEGRPDVEASEQTAMGLYNLEHLELLRDPSTSTKCLVAWGHDTVLVAFRGTANRQNAMHDIKAWLVPHDPEETARTACGLRSGPSVHSGFSASWQKALKKAVCSLIQKAVSDADHASKMRLLITGHSLGGVMAVLAAYDIADMLPWRSVQVYTVGAPRPGNKAFAEQYLAKAPDTWHIMNATDPVPRIGKFGVLYSRPGHKVVLDAGGEMQVRPTPLDMRLSSINPVRKLTEDLPFLVRLLPRCTVLNKVKSHYLVSYRASLVDVIKEELKRPRFDDGLEGVLELCNSISLTDILQAADLETSAQESNSLTAEAAMQSVQDVVIGAVSPV